jgi:hypothetical protein
LDDAREDYSALGNGRCFGLHTFAVVPQPARAHGDVVTMKEVFMPGTIVVRTNERHLYSAFRIEAFR